MHHQVGPNSLAEDRPHGGRDDAGSRHWRMVRRGARGHCTPVSACHGRIQRQMVDAGGQALRRAAWSGVKRVIVGAQPETRPKSNSQFAAGQL